MCDSLRIYYLGCRQYNAGDSNPRASSCGGRPSCIPELEQVYHYVLLHLGPLQVTRKGVNLAVSSSCLTFTVLQSAHLIMCTTTPEAMASGMRWYLRPLRLFRAPVDEIIFTLLLSLRFTSIVFEEIRNISLGLAARGVDWRGLGWRGTVTLASSLLSRTLESLFVTSQAVADASRCKRICWCRRTPFLFSQSRCKVWEFYSRLGCLRYSHPLAFRLLLRRGMKYSYTTCFLSFFKCPLHMRVPHKGLISGTLMGSLPKVV